MICDIVCEKEDHQQYIINTYFKFDVKSKAVMMMALHKKLMIRTYLIWS